MSRSFSHRLATRDKTPLLIGIVGPSSSGKTYSGLRLMTGFQRVNPGEIFVIDTEAGRSLQYADEFRFQHVPFGAPFAPLDYLDVIKYCVDNGAKNILIDSMSHEWEGPGGVLEIQQAEFKRLGAKPSVQGFSWGKPKSEHQRLINGILQFNCNFILCFRAKETLDWDAKKPDGTKAAPQKEGYTAIGGGAWRFELTAQCLLLEQSRGVPTWKSDLPGEQRTFKLPKQFETTFASNPQLSEDVGEAMAKWANGAKPVPKMTAAQLIAEYKACSEPSEFRRLEEIRAVSWSSIAGGEKPDVKAASAACSQRMEDAAKGPEYAATPNDDEDETTTETETVTDAA